MLYGVIWLVLASMLGALLLMVLGLRGPVNETDQRCTELDGELG